MNAPPTDKTRFDDWLKAWLYRDIIFRLALAGGISAVATHQAVVKRGLSPVKYFAQLSDAIAPLVNNIGSIGIALCVLALLFKDLEEMAPLAFGRASIAGGVGGVVRRIAGDISLWTFGALVAVVVSASVAAASVATTPRNALALLAPYSITLLILFGTGVVNYFVRRGAPSPWHSAFRSPVQAVLAYSAVLLAQGLAVWA